MAMPLNQTHSCSILFRSVGLLLMHTENKYFMTTQTLAAKIKKYEKTYNYTTAFILSRKVPLVVLLNMILVTLPFHNNNNNYPWHFVLILIAAIHKYIIIKLCVCIHGYASCFDVHYTNMSVVDVWIGFEKDRVCCRLNNIIELKPNLEATVIQGEHTVLTIILIRISSPRWIFNKLRWTRFPHGFKAENAIWRELHMFYGQRHKDRIHHFNVAYTIFPLHLRGIITLSNFRTNIHVLAPRCSNIYYIIHILKICACSLLFHLSSVYWML